jgi:hypothetical protein
MIGQHFVDRSVRHLNFVALESSFLHLINKFYGSFRTPHPQKFPLLSLSSNWTRVSHPPFLSSSGHPLSRTWPPKFKIFRSWCSGFKSCQIKKNGLKVEIFKKKMGNKNGLIQNIEKIAGWSTGLFQFMVKFILSSCPTWRKNRLKIKAFLLYFISYPRIIVQEPSQVNHSRYLKWFLSA